MTEGVAQQQPTEALDLDHLLADAELAVHVVAWLAALLRLNETIGLIPTHLLLGREEEAVRLQFQRGRQVGRRRPVAQPAVQQNARRVVAALHACPLHPMLLVLVTGRRWRGSGRSRGKLWRLCLEQRDLRVGVVVQRRAGRRRRRFGEGAHRSSSSCRRCCRSLVLLLIGGDHRCSAGALVLFPRRGELGNVLERVVGLDQPLLDRRQLVGVALFIGGEPPALVPEEAVSPTLTDPPCDVHPLRKRIVEIGKDLVLVEFQALLLRRRLLKPPGRARR